MDPEVPQALRLQAILMGGIVIVHARQEGFLLEDAQEMLVGAGSVMGARARVQLDAGAAAAAAAAAAALC